MSAREDLVYRITRHCSAETADGMVEAFRAEVLREAANAVTALREEKRTGRPDHWTLTVADGVGEAADLLRRMATEAGEPGDA